MKLTKAKGVPVVVHEPNLGENEFCRSEVIRDLEEFKRRCDVIVTNRPTTELDNMAGEI